MDDCGQTQSIMKLLKLKGYRLTQAEGTVSILKLLLTSRDLYLFLLCLIPKRLGIPC